MGFLRKLGKTFSSVGGALGAVPGLNIVGGALGIGGSLLQGKAPNLTSIGTLVPGLGTVAGIAGGVGSLAGLAGRRGGGSTNMNVMPTGSFLAPPPAFLPGTGSPIVNTGNFVGSGGTGGLPAVIPSATALQRFLAWAGAIALGQTAADAVAQLVTNGIPWSQWSQGARNVWNQFANSGSANGSFNAKDPDSCMMPIVVEPVYEMRATAPRGYVIVEHNGQKVAMEKSRARACGKWSPAKKPPITAAEYRQLQTAARVEKKIKGLATKAGQVCRPRKTSR